VEGIETQAQADYFAANSHYIHAQGWHFGRPVSARAFLQLLDEEEERQSKQEEVPNGVTVAAF
jgi:sensor c-di-GMP phosphodiesterase-like protein